MQTGFAILCAGYVRTKNVQNTLLKNIIDACGASLGFYTVGYAFAFGGNGSVSDSARATFIGTENFFLMGVEDKAVLWFQYAFAATSATIVAGTLAERCQMLTYLLYSTAMTAFVYPVVAHSIWSSNGFLSSYNVAPFLGVGVVDFAGSTVVHVTGGVTALIAAKILGPRKGRFYFVTSSDGKETRVANNFPGHSIALKVRVLHDHSSFFKRHTFHSHHDLPPFMLDTWDINSLVLLVWLQHWFGLIHHKQGARSSCSECRN